MATIFISYRRDDAGGYSGRIAQDLRARFGNDQVFVDLSIGAGCNFEREIERAIAACGAVVALIGPRWLGDADADGGRRLDDPGDFLRLELLAALRRAAVIIPVLVHGASLPEPAQLPAPLRPLLKYQALELSDQRWTYDVQQLIAALERAGVRRPGARSWRLWIAALSALVLGCLGLRFAGALFSPPGRVQTEAAASTARASEATPAIGEVLLSRQGSAAATPAPGAAAPPTAPVRVDVALGRDQVALYRDAVGRILALVVREADALDLSSSRLLMFSASAPQRFDGIPIDHIGSFRDGRRQIWYTEEGSHLTRSLTADEQKIEIECSPRRVAFERLTPQQARGHLEHASFFRMEWAPRALGHDTAGNWTYLEHHLDEDQSAAASWRMFYGPAHATKAIAITLVPPPDALSHQLSVFTSLGSFHVSFDPELGLHKETLRWDMKGQTSTLTAVPAKDSLKLLSELGLYRAPALSPWSRCDP